MKTPEQAFADAREDANRLRLHGHKAQADSIDRVCDTIAASMPDYLTWLSESEAILRSGWRVRRLREAFPGWEAQGMAEKRGRLRYYRQVMIPRRANLEAARADAERMARAS